MVEIEGPTSCIYMSIRLLNVLGNCGVCRDTTRGCRAFVVLHAVVGVNEQHFNTSGNYFCQTARPGRIFRCVPVIRGRQTRVKADEEIRVGFFDLFEKLENPLP
jgi:hypothetical protein